MEAVNQMAMIERERHFSGLSLGKFALPFKVRRTEAQGTAVLSFACGRAVTVEAAITQLRSALSVSGGGQMRCPSDMGFNALGADDWLTLTFPCGTTVFIDVYDIKSYSDGSCRCLFEVVG